MSGCGEVLFTPLATYGYTVGASGNRLTAVEALHASALNAHPSTINRVYTYDNLYRLTGESLTFNSQPSTLDYAYDPVGNRLSRTVAGAPLQPQSFGFDANDRLNSDSYDANGNTLFGQGFGQSQADRYDSENRLVQRVATASTLSYTYDGDGNRVSKTVTTATNTVTTYYVVDDLNPTGYSQVLEEHVSFNLQPATLNLVYTYGHTLISQDRLEGTNWRTSFYGVDGHNNVRYLTDIDGRVTDTYDYDAYGNLISRTGTTPNNYLFSGEQFDPDLGLYYLRARYHNPDTGRFWTQDSYEGSGSDPSSLHKYTYCANNPVNAWDPSGNFTVGELSQSTLIRSTLSFSLWGAVSGGTEALLRGADPVTGAISGALSGAVCGAGFGLIGGPAWLASLPAGYWTTAQGLKVLAVLTGLGAHSVNEAIKEGEYGVAAFRAILTVMPLFQAMRSFTAQEAAVYYDAYYAAERGPGALSRLRYREAEYHGLARRPGKNPAPVNGQGALDSSVGVKTGAIEDVEGNIIKQRRIALDDKGQFTVFDYQRDGFWHGHVRAWTELPNDLKAAFIRAGLATTSGKPIP